MNISVIGESIFGVCEEVEPASGLIHDFRDENKIGEILKIAVDFSSSKSDISGIIDSLGRSSVVRDVD